MPYPIDGLDLVVDLKAAEVPQFAGTLTNQPGEFRCVCHFQWSTVLNVSREPLLPPLYTRS